MGNNGKEGEQYQNQCQSKMKISGRYELNCTNPAEPIYLWELPLASDVAAEFDLGSSGSTSMAREVRGHVSMVMLTSNE